MSAGVSQPAMPPTLCSACARGRNAAARLCDVCGIQTGVGCLIIVGAERFAERGCKNHFRRHAVAGTY